jgi:hypothetical protein
LGLSLVVSIAGSAFGEGAKDAAQAFPVNEAEADALAAEHLKADVATALAGPPNELEATISDLISDRPADEIGKIAEGILSASKDAPIASRASVARALGRHVVALRSAGRDQAAEQIVSALRVAAERGDRAALRTYEKIVSAALILPRAPVGTGLNPRTVSTAE